MVKNFGYWMDRTLSENCLPRLQDRPRQQICASRWIRDFSAYRLWATHGRIRGFRYLPSVAHWIFHSTYHALQSHWPATWMLKGYIIDLCAWPLPFPTIKWMWFRAAVFQVLLVAQETYVVHMYWKANTNNSSNNSSFYWICSNTQPSVGSKINLINRK